jgi:hypothetical protein
LTNCLLMTLVVHNLHGVAADTKSLFWQVDCHSWYCLKLSMLFFSKEFSLILVMKK